MTEEYPDDLKKLEDESYESDDSSEQPPSDIVAFNELRSCADLVRMYDTGQLDIKPDFQRDIVWKNADQTRFIDSLTKQLPIPSMCISLDYNTGERLVIDGLQRMQSIIQFLTNDQWRLSTLPDIDPKISGRKVEHIQDKHPAIYDRVENVTIPITVLRCDYKKRNHMEFLFTIFHRLNAGGNKLNNQEIRNCIYSGPYNSTLRDLAGLTTFRELLELEAGETYRFIYQEFVLRTLAFADKYEGYEGNLSRFLNGHMMDNRDGGPTVDALRDSFIRSCACIYNKITDGQPLPDVSKATKEALFVAVMRNIDTCESDSPERLVAKFDEMRQAPEFTAEQLKNAITSRAKQLPRLERAVGIFAR